MISLLLSMISLLLQESEAKPRMSVNIKDIIRMYLGYNLFIYQKTAPINAFFVKCKQWLLVISTYQSFFCTTNVFSFHFSSGDKVISTYRPIWVIIQRMPLMYSIVPA